MGKLSKREASIRNINAHQKLFQCPICESEMVIEDKGAIRCPENHSFDIAKQGYINFMTKPVHSMYSKELFESRYEVIQSGLYDKVHEKIAKLIGAETETILDAGCGEGSHLMKITDRMNHRVIPVGIDIAKEGIATAAKHTEQKLWCVGDLANSPFKKQTFDCILNFLSPANYLEFQRLLTPQGKVIKVVPQEGYLQQLRKQAYAQSEKEHYTNEQTVNRFKEQYTKVDVHRINYTLPIDPKFLPNLLGMTPLGWHVKNTDEIQIREITIDLDILVGQ